MNLEDDERAVICAACNCYLYAETRELGGEEARMAQCPYWDADARECNPPLTEGRYGRS